MCLHFIFGKSLNSKILRQVRIKNRGVSENIKIAPRTVVLGAAK